MASTPRVRVVVVNYDGGDMTLRCLESLRQIDWPEESLEIVLVDNASIDGIAPRIRDEMPWVHLIESISNTGFAGGVNQGLDGLENVDYVALLNNDATPDRNWLRPLVAALEEDETLGAVSSKIVFAPGFIALTIDSPVFLPPNDTREHGVCITGIEVDGVDVLGETQFADGCYTPKARRVDEDVVCWTAGHAEVRLPVTPGDDVPEFVQIALLAETEKTIRLSCGAESLEVQVDRAPTWHKVPVGGPPFDVINNVGSRLVEGGYGGDRGFLDRDDGQYEEPEEVFAWCGASVLMSTRYLRKVGKFDGRYFVYYEDTDLSWRGRIAGWRYRYVPTSVVRHIHAATSKEGSRLFGHFVERNRLTTLARNAPWPVVFNSCYVYLRDSFVILKRDVVGRMRAGRGPHITGFARRIRAFAGFLKLLPRTLLSRARQLCRPRRRREIWKRWATPF